MEKMRRILIRMLELSVSVLFIAITGITFAEVFCRYVLGFSLTWSHELVVLFFIWTVWLCIPIGLNKNSHIKMTILNDRISKPAQKRISLLVCALSLIFFVFLFFLTFPVIESFDGMFLTTIPFPIKVHYYAMVIGSLLSLFVLITRRLERRNGGQ
jgi:TRAP-type C4-dicarboxylate transport system permease small subunit